MHNVRKNEFVNSFQIKSGVLIKSGVVLESESGVLMIIAVKVAQDETKRLSFTVGQKMVRC